MIKAKRVERSQFIKDKAKRESRQYGPITEDAEVILTQPYIWDRLASPYFRAILQHYCKRSALLKGNVSVSGTGMGNFIAGDTVTPAANGAIYQLAWRSKAIHLVVSHCACAYPGVSFKLPSCLFEDASTFFTRPAIFLKKTFCRQINGLALSRQKNSLFTAFFCPSRLAHLKKACYSYVLSQHTHQGLPQGEPGETPTWRCGEK